MRNVREEKLRRAWAYCKTHRGGQLLESQEDYDLAEEHSNKTGEEWFDSPVKVAEAIEAEAAALAEVEVEVEPAKAKTTKKPQL